MSIFTILQSLAPAPLGGALVDGQVVLAEPSEEGFSAALATAIASGEEAVQGDGSTFSVQQGGVPSSTGRPSAELTEVEAQVLLEVEALVEGLDQDIGVPLLQLLQVLESQAPAGIRVQSSGYKAAAVTDQAQIFWQGLLTTVQNGVVGRVGGAVASKDAEGTAGPSLGERGQQLVVDWLKNVLSRLADLMPKDAEGFLRIQLSPGDQPQTPAQGDVLNKPDASFAAAMKPEAVSDDPLEKPAEFLAKSAKKASSELELKGQDRFKEFSPENEAVESAKRSRSAVVVLTAPEDRLRATVLRAFFQKNQALDSSIAAPVVDQTSGSAQPSARLPSWLEWLRKQVSSVEEVVTRWESVAEKSLSFLQFVQRKRQQPLGLTAREPSKLAGDQTKDTASGDEDRVSLKGDAGRYLNRPASSQGPRYGGLLLNVSSPSKSTVRQVLNSDTSDAVVPTQGRERPAQKPLEVIDSTLLNGPASSGKEMLEAQVPVQKDEALGMNKATQAHASPSTTQVSRWTLEQVQQVMAQAKEHMQLWVDRKLVAMEIQLEPAELGRMSMKTILEQGRIGVLFQVESSAVRDLMLQQAQQLREILESQGLELAGLHVEVSDRQDGRAQHGPQKDTGTEFDIDKLLSKDEESGQGPVAPKLGLIDSRA